MNQKVSTNWLHAENEAKGASMNQTGLRPGSSFTQYAQPQSSHPQVEVGPAQDMFVVYRGKRDNALDYPAVWRYIAKDALRSPDVPAVDEFRKLIAKSEKQQTAAP